MGKKLATKTTGLVTTLAQAETVCRTIAAKLRKAGYTATVVPSTTRVSVRVKDHKPGSVFGYVPRATTEISSPYFKRTHAGGPLDLAYVESKNYNIVRGVMTPAQVEALVTKAMRGHLLPKK